MSRRRRLDADLVRRNLVASRTEAQELIDLRRVLVNGAVADKSSRLVDPGDAVVVEGPPARFVSRGGEKLAAALEAFGVDVSGRRILDAGASTGGFTDCLLQADAAHVVALDVGHGQLHPRIRTDARVTVIERFNVRDVDCEAIGGPVDAVVADLSFISLTLVARALLGVCREGADVIVLVKPQFEAGRRDVARGRGVIADPEIHRRAIDDVVLALESSGAEIRGVIESPVRGAEGNKEFLLHAVARGRMSS